MRHLQVTNDMEDACKRKGCLPKDIPETRERSPSFPECSGPVAPPVVDAKGHWISFQLDNDVKRITYNELIPVVSSLTALRETTIMYSRHDENFVKTYLQPHLQQIGEDIIVTRTIDALKLGPEMELDDSSAHKKVAVVVSGRSLQAIELCSEQENWNTYDWHRVKCMHRYKRTFLIQLKEINLDTIHGRFDVTWPKMNSFTWPELESEQEGFWKTFTCHFNS